MTAIRGKTGAGPLALCAIAFGLQACGPAKPAGPPPPTPAQACLQTTDPAQGLDACKTAVGQSPDDAALRRRMGLLRLKSHSLAAARQAYQIALSQNPNDAEAQFGLGLTLEAIGEPKANLRKVEAVKRDPAVVDLFRKYGIADVDLMTFDTAPQITSIPGPGTYNALIPKQPLAQGLSVDVRCLVGLKGMLHDCTVLTPIKPGQEVFGEAAKAILVITKVAPARNKGAPIADAPIVQTFVFWPKS